jgi:Ala-tRNA(Pro) deacylase
MNAKPPATRAELFRLLDLLGIAYETISHPPLFTVQQARSVLPETKGARTKNLFLVDRRGSLLLVSALETTAVDLKALARHLGLTRLSFGAAPLLREALGVEPGSVTPFALMNDPGRRVKAILDRAILDAPRVSFHPLSNDASTILTPEGLRAFLAHVGHAPRIVSFAQLRDEA